MTSIQCVDSMDEGEKTTDLQENNSVIPRRRILRNKRSASVCVPSSTASNPSPLSSAPTINTSVLERRNSMHYFLNSEYQSASQNLSMHSESGQSFMAQRVTITRLRSSTDFLRKETTTTTQQTLSPKSMDIDVHVVCGSSSVIKHINLKKKKLMDCKDLPNTRARKSTSPLKKSTPKEDIIKSDDVKHLITDVPGKVPNAVLNRKANRSNKILKAKEINAAKGKIKVTKSNELSQKGGKSAKEGGAVTKKVNKKCSRFTQTDSNILQPCRSFLDNKNCPIQLICPYLHSEFPCKYYYLGLECPHDNFCKFMHNGPLSEKMKDSLRSHILEHMSANQSDAVDQHFLQQIHDKQDLWQCLQDFQNKLKTEWIAGQSENAREQHKFLKPQTIEIASVCDSEMEDQLTFLTPQQQDLLCSNYCIRNREELMQLRLGELHQMGIIEGNQVSAIIHVALGANKKTEQGQEDRQDQNVSVLCNVNKEPIFSTDIIEVDDDDEYGAKLVIDESCNESNANSQDVSSDMNPSAETTTSSQDRKEEEEQYHCYPQTDSIIASVEHRLQQLKNTTIPNREKSLELMAIYDKLADQEQQILKNNPDIVIPPQYDVEECYQILKETNRIIDSVEDRLGKIKNSTHLTNNEKTVELMAICEELNHQEELIKRKSICGERTTENKVDVDGPLQSADDDCVMFDYDDGVKSLEATIVVDGDHLERKEHMPFNSTEDVVSVEVPHSEAMEIVSIEIIPPYSETQEINTSLRDISPSTCAEEVFCSNDVITGDTTYQTNYQPTESGEVITDCEVVELPLTLELSPTEKEIIDEFSVTRMDEEIKETDEDSPPYEDIVSSEENTPKNKQKFCSSINRKERPRLRSDNIHNTEDTPMTLSQEADEVCTSTKTKPFKPRRLKIPKTSEKIKAKVSTNDKDNEDKPPAAAPQSETKDEHLEPKVIMSMRYAKKAKLKLQNKVKNTQADIQNVALVSPESKKYENDMTDESVESLMSALYEGEGGTCEDIMLEETNSLTSSDDLLRVEKSTKVVSSNNPVTTKSRTKLNQRNKVISLKIAAAGLPKNKRLKSRNITFTKSLVRRRVSFETPDTTTTTNSSLSSKADIVSKFQRGKPYVVLTKLKPHLLKTLRKQSEDDSSSTSYTSITTTCNITNTGSSNATTTTTSSSSFVLNTCCLCDGTSHVLGQKRSCLTNNNIDEEKDYECNLNAQHKLLKLDSMNILGENSMECESPDGNTMTQRITYHKNVVFEDITTTDYYSSSDEKPSEEILHSESATMPSTSNQRKVCQQEGQHKIKSILRRQIENVCNKSDVQFQENDEDITKTTEDSRDLEQCRQIEKKITYLQIEEEDRQHHSAHEDAVDENQNVNVKIRPPTPLKSNSKSSYVHRLRSSGEEIETKEGGDTNHTKAEDYHKSSEGVVVKYATDDEDDNNKNKGDYIYTPLHTKSTPQMVKRQIDFDSNSGNVTPIASPTHVVYDSIASPSPVRGGGTGGLLVAAVEYFLGEIDARLTYPFMPYILREIELSGLTVNKPNNMDKLMKTSSLDPRIFRRDVKSTNINNAFNQPSTHYQTFTTPSPANTPYHPTVSPYDPRSRAQHVAQASPQTPSQNAMVCYNANSSASSALMAAAPSGVMQHFMPTPMNAVAVQPTPQQQTPNMVLYESIQNSSWYHSLPSSSKMQVNQSVTHLVTALNNFQRERRSNPTLVFDIFKLDNAIELLDNMKNLGIFVDMNGNITKQQSQSAQMTSCAGHACQVAGTAATVQTQQPCNATYSFIQQVLAPTAQCAVRMPGCSAAVPSIHEPFVSYYVEQPKPVAISCCAHKHQNEEIAPQQRPKEQSSPPPSCDDNYNDNNHRGNYNNQFRKPYNQNQSQKPYNNNQRFNNNPRFSKPSSSYGGGGGDSFSSPTRSSSPPSQSFSPRGGGGGGRGRFNRRQQNSGDGSSWSSSPPSSSSSKPFNNNRRFNRNNNFNKNSNSNYGNNNSNNTSPPRTSSPLSSRYGNYGKSSSPPPSLPEHKSPPNLSPRSDKPRSSSPVLSSPVKQKNPPSTDEECWD